MLTLTLSLPDLPWWGWVLAMLTVIYLAGALWVGVASRDVRAGLVWPLWLLVCALGAGPQ